MKFHKSGLITLLSFLFVTFSCSSLSDKPWYEAIPNNSVGVFVPQKNATVKQIVESNAGSFFDDITASGIPILQDIELAAKQPLRVLAIAFFPSEADQLQTIWVIDNQTSVLAELKQHFKRPLFVDEYYFKNVRIHKLSVDNKLFFLLEADDYLYVSESSKAIEATISTINEEDIAASITAAQASKNDVFLFNSGVFDKWINQYSAVKYSPLINQSFKGLGLGLIDYTFIQDNDKAFTFNGLFPVRKDSLSPLVQAISYSNNVVSLDQYIPTDAAAFSIHFNPSSSKPILSPISDLDNALRQTPSIINSLVDALDLEMAFVTFPPSGLAGFGENLVIRKVKDVRAVYEWLRNLESRGLATSSDNTFYLHSGYLASIIGGGLAGYETFYLGVTSEAIVISPRLGLTNRVRSDRSRRRVISYSQSYIDLKANLSETVSTLFYGESRSFESYIQRYLGPNASIAAFSSKFELIAGAITKESDNSIQLELNAYNKKRSTQPFEEKWIAPMDGATITGPPIIADIGGSNRNEIVVANSMRRVLGIANDGTIYFSAETGQDMPIGSPVVYDWYGNGQDAIMVAAGNKIYAWNTTGSLLPKFPFVVSEQITAPLLVADINRDGIAEVIVTTADRQIYALNGRGEPLKGWPVSTSGEIRFKPYFESINGKWTLFTVADNGLYGFDSQGRLIDGFPVYISSSFTSNPSTINNGLMIGAADGHLYRLGTDRMFIDSLNVLRNTAYDSLANGLRLSARYVSSDPINAAPIMRKLQVKTDSIKVYNEEILLVQTLNGSLIGINTLGELRYVTNMGQTSSSTSSILIADLQTDKKPEILAVASFGRLYAWEIYSGNRYYDLPTSAIEYPILSDIDGDGIPELIAQTRGGVRCWTIYGNKEISLDNN